MIQRRNLSLFLVGLVLIFASLACLAGSAPEAAAPEPEATSQAIEPAATEAPAAEETAPTLPPVLVPTPTIIAQIQPQPAINETRRLTLEFPPTIRTGDSARIRLRLEVDDLGNITPTAIVEGNVIAGEVVEIPNLYETHNVIAEARLDLAGMEVQPPGTINEPMTQGQSVTFYWSVRPNESGKYEGTAWLHLRFVSKQGGEETRIPVSVQFLEIEAKSFLGLVSGSAARGIGALGSVLGSVLGFPFVDDIVKWLWKRIRGIG